MEDAIKEEIEIYPDAAGLARAAASLFRASAGEAIAAGARFTVALSGGATPRLLFHLLGTEYGDAVEWKGVHLFWADERAVPPDHELSNYRMAHAELIVWHAIPQENVHRIKGELPPAQAARDYEKELHAYFGKKVMPRFDLLLLGVGEDGHTASLFPGSDALGEKNRIAVPVFSSTMPNWRISLTLPVLNNASRIVFLVSGPSKAGVIGRILGEGKRETYPAGLVQPVKGSVLWLLDQEAASQLH